MTLGIRANLNLGRYENFLMENGVLNFQKTF